MNEHVSKYLQIMNSRPMEAHALELRGPASGGILNHSHLGAQ